MTRYETNNYRYNWMATSEAALNRALDRIEAWLNRWLDKLPS